MSRVSVAGDSRSARPGGPAASAASIRAVFEWYRRRLRLNHFRKSIPPLPSELSGWVLANAGEACEPDGTLPLGAIRDRLRSLLVEARLDERERVVVEVQFGLSEYPTSKRSRELRHRLPALRVRQPEGLGKRRIRDLAGSAFERLDNLIAERGLFRPGPRAVDAAAVGDPCFSVWFRSQVPVRDQPSLFERAVHEARVFASLPGIEGEVGDVLAEIDAYHALVASEPWPPRPRRYGRSRARALVSLALWELVTRPNRTSAAKATPAPAGRLHPPSTLSPVASTALGAFLTGDYSDEVVLAACPAVLELAERDRSAAGIAADLLLGACGEPGDSPLSRDARATVLRTVVRVRAADEDPTAVALAWRAYADHPLHWQTIGALQEAVRVASAYGCYGVADELCRCADRVMAEQFRIRDGYDRNIERREFQLWSHHQRSATLRRRLDDGAGSRVLEQALREQAAAERDWDTARDNAARAPSDVDDTWRFFLAVRRVELDLIQAQRAPAGLQRQRSLLNAHRTIGEAAAIAAAARFRILEYVPLLKVRLAQAIVANEPEQAVEPLERLHALGWPLSRCGATVFAISQPSPERRRALSALRARIDDVAAAQRSPSWKPAGASTSAGWRSMRVRRLG